MRKSIFKSILEKRRKKGKNDNEWGFIIVNLSGIIVILSSYIFEVRNPDAPIDPYFDEIRKILGACGLLIFFRAFFFLVSLDSYRLFGEVLHFNRRILNVRLFRKISWITLDVIVVIMLYLLIDDLNWIYVVLPIVAGVVALIIARFKVFRKGL